MDADRNQTLYAPVFLNLGSIELLEFDESHPKHD